MLFFAKKNLLNVAIKIFVALLKNLRKPDKCVKHENANSVTSVFFQYYPSS